MKQLREIEKKTEEARRRLRGFLIAVQCNVTNHIGRCKCMPDDRCLDCQESIRLYEESQNIKKGA